MKDTTEAQISARKRAWQIRCIRAAHGSLQVCDIPPHIFVKLEEALEEALQYHKAEGIAARRERLMREVFDKGSVKPIPF